MRVSREKAAENRSRIVAEASRQFRERGFDAVGVDGLMKAVGLTHGGFYGHFRSKDDLIAEATRFGLEDSVRKQSDQTSLQKFLADYLSTRHRDGVGKGCLLASIGGDLARQPGEVRIPLTKYVQGEIGRIGKLVTGRTAEARRRKAIAAVSGSIGALMLARAVDDPALSDEILAAARTALDEAFGPASAKQPAV